MNRYVYAGLSLALFLGLSSAVTGSRVASAEVVFNERVEAVSSRDNPCEPGTDAISLVGVIHHVWYTTPDGTLKMNIQGHLTGTDSDGTEYILNTQQHMEHFAWPSVLPYTDRVTLNLISEGAGVNALVVITVETPATITVTACRP
jgi:hypothetical protein